MLQEASWPAYRAAKRYSYGERLGSSSACIVAGLLGANRFLGSPLSMQELVNLACEIEGHPDNIAPAFLGGLVTSAMEGGRVHSISVPVSPKFILRR